ncbi:helicase HerA domain-containing protein [Terasakiella sp.]|uniref:helicase HerA domain-containing protein n=1 Tax=Terasakiella sp. TaxID=2034861 RepID=UPI003AA84A4D
MKKKPPSLFQRATPKRPAPVRLFSEEASKTAVGTVAENEQRLVLTMKDRQVHSHIVGSTGSGKSKLIEYLIRQDMKNPKCGLCLIDPHGQLYDDLVHYVSHRHPRLAKRIVLFNPAADLEQVLGFNPIPTDTDDLEPTANQLTSSVLKALGQDSSIGTPRISRWLKNIFYPLVANKLTLLEAFPFFSIYDSSRRQDILKTIYKETVLDDWVSFDKMSPQKRIETIEGAANRLVHFLENRRIRHMIGQSAHTLDLGEIMREGKILLVNLNGGLKISHESTHLLGIFLVNELFRYAKLRNPDDKTLKPFHVYIDEFGQYVTRDIARTLEECRKNKVFMTLAHQHLSQLKTDDEQLFNSVLTNCKNKYVFGGLSKKDAEIMADAIAAEYLDPTEIKDEIISTKVHHEEETRTVLSRSQSSAQSNAEGGNESIGVTDGTNLGLNKAESFGVGQSDSVMNATSHMDGRSTTDSTNKGETNTDTVGDTQGTGQSSADTVAQGHNRNHSDTVSESDSENWSNTDTTTYNNTFARAKGASRGHGESRPERGEGGSNSKSKSRFENQSESVSSGGSHAEMRGGSHSDGRSSTDNYGESYNESHMESTSTHASQHSSKAHSVQESSGHAETTSEADTITRSEGHGDSSSYTVQNAQNIGVSHNESLMQGSSWNKAETVTESSGQSTVPFLRPVEYREVTSRTFWSLQEQHHKWLAAIKKQDMGQAFIKIGSQMPVQVEIDYVSTPFKSPRTSPGKVDRFVQDVFANHAHYYTPLAAVHEEYENRQRALFSDGEAIMFDEMPRLIEHEEVIEEPETEPEIENPFNE